MIKVFTSIVFMLFSQNNSNSNPVRLEKKESKSEFEVFCEKAAPYVLFLALAIFTILLLIILVKYGASITGTEANQYGRLQQITVGN